MAAELRSFSEPPDGTVLQVSAAAFDDGIESAAAEATTVTHTVPGLMLGMTDDRDPVEPGQTLTYALTFSNRRTLNGSGGVLRAPVPVGTTFASASDGGTVVDGAVEWMLDTLAPGQVGQRMFSVVVDPAADNGSVIRATAEVFDSGAAPSTATAEAVTVIRATHALTLSVELGPDPVAPGEGLMAALTVTNQGASDLTGVVVQALVPDYLNYFPAENYDAACPAPTSLCDPGDLVSWTVGPLAAGASQTVFMAAELRSFSEPPDGTVLQVSAAAFDDGIERSARAISIVWVAGAQCNDGTDNDRDGLTDHDGAGIGDPDPQCAGRPWGRAEGKKCAAGFAPLIMMLILMARRMQLPQRTP